MDEQTVHEFLDGIHTREPVAGLTHDFYRYPARFSPLFTRAAIKAFSSQGDLVLDPFMGGATSAVEALAAGRHFAGCDISSLAVFLARAKTTALTDADLRAVERWAERSIGALNIRRRSFRPEEWITAGYQRNLNDRQTWPIRKALELMLEELPRLRMSAQRLFARAAILKTAQWALDCRSETPSVARFRERFLNHIAAMSEGARQFRETLNEGCTSSPVLLHRSAIGLENDPVIRALAAPRLIVTSPPYPGVHVVYHRWQILGRKETPAPYWIANSLDGNGLSHYTFGDRKQPGLAKYFETVRATFKSIAALCDRSTMIVQMVAFSDPSWQVPEYLDALADAGLKEAFYPQLANADDGRVWRTVPNRKWYADQRGEIAASSEVVLFHRRR